MMKTELVGEEKQKGDDGADAAITPKDKAAMREELQKLLAADKKHRTGTALVEIRAVLARHRCLILSRIEIVGGEINSGYMIVARDE